MSFISFQDLQSIHSSRYPGLKLQGVSSCRVCSQVLQQSDLREHSESHSIDADFPRLGSWKEGGEKERNHRGRNSLWFGSLIAQFLNKDSCLIKYDSKCIFLPLTFWNMHLWISGIEVLFGHLRTSLWRSLHVCMCTYVSWSLGSRPTFSYLSSKQLDWRWIVGTCQSPNILRATYIFHNSCAYRYGFRWLAVRLSSAYRD